MTTRRLDFVLLGLAAFGILNAVLYSVLLPLWDGFDEPFHYGYVETLASRHTIPKLGSTFLSQEIMQSLRLAPASQVVQHNLPFVTTFSEYFALPAPERALRRADLKRLSPELRQSNARGSPNYEAQQAPLAYLLMVPADLQWGREPLPRRVLQLRLFCAIAACLLQIAGTLALARLLEMDAATSRLAVFLVLSAQMFYASVAHVSNDWLAIPLSTWTLVALLRFWRQPQLGSASLLGWAVAAGLLTKAYFLVWLLVAAAAVAWIAARRRNSELATVFMTIVLVVAGPWYIRNLVLYGNLSGIQPDAGGALRAAEVVRAASSLPWGRTLLPLMRGSLWTGNSSFTSFSRATLDVMLVLLLAGAFWWLRSARKSASRSTEALLAAGCLTFLAAVLYNCVVFFAQSKGTQVTATPWYTQAVAAPLMCLVCLGFSRSGRLGRWASVVLAALSAYVIAATYAVKLIPIYAGCASGRTRLMDLYNCYVRDAGARRQVLAQTALGSPAVVTALAGAVAATAAALLFFLCKSVLSERNPVRCRR
jgi:hypothetical protein